MNVTGRSVSSLEIIGWLRQYHGHQASFKPPPPPPPSPQPDTSNPPPNDASLEGAGAAGIDAASLVAELALCLLLWPLQD